MNNVLKNISACQVCKGSLPFHPRPVVQLSNNSKIIIISQAPGLKVHETGIPWNDASGKKLRSWLGVDDHSFYNAEHFSLMPMGFCYPGKGKSGDLPPRKECGRLWHPEILKNYDSAPVILLVGQYAQQYYLKGRWHGLTETVKNYNKFLPEFFPLPHPSPRNQNWLKVNPWFEEKVLPDLKSIICKQIKINLSR